VVVATGCAPVAAYGLPLDSTPNDDATADTVQDAGSDVSPAIDAAYGIPPDAAFDNGPAPAYGLPPDAGNETGVAPAYGLPPDAGSTE
jgi:hypothetical protein